MSVLPSVRTELGSHWTDIHEIWYLSIFRKSVRKIQVSLKSDKNSGYFTWTAIVRLWSYLAEFLLEWEMFQKKSCSENQKHILRSVTSSPKIVPLGNNMEKYDTAHQATNDNLIRRTRFACWIPKATNTQSEYVILIPFPRRQQLREMLRLYVHCLVQGARWSEIYLSLLFREIPSYFRQPSWQLTHVNV